MVEQAIKEGKIPPSTKEEAIRIAMLDPNAYEKMIEKMDAVYKVDEKMTVKNKGQLTAMSTEIAEKYKIDVEKVEKTIQEMIEKGKITL